ncbi:Chaperone protein HtpG [Rosistilla oblonga]|uniref:HD domain-containing protein n=1 Tax=Rosistilla oblonga TaxID=2527990 RepID=UPI00118B16F9|nr:ATP-binding protein [Rosistilla oblonga]QDV13773.1 Chaperone protein HtpG [Rosistilla oblonga]
MKTIEATKLWKAAFEMDYPKGTLEETFQSKLESSFRSFRYLTSMLLGEIDRSFRDLTVHDITHTDALWQSADLLCGGAHGVTLNPSETFVLGGALLLHDAGLALSSYDEDILSIRTNAAWRDAASFFFRRIFDRRPRGDEIEASDPEFLQKIDEHFLRSRHAKQAEVLTNRSFGDNSIFLIEDHDLRESFGYSIGQVAYSHWWPADKTAAKLDRHLGACPLGPAEWTVDLLKIAFLVRCADSIQIDSRRAPALLRALRKPSGLSSRHWKVQEKLQQPYVRNGAVEFSSKSPFPLSDSDSWWIGHDLLSLADRELKSAEVHLLERRRRPLAANRVAGIGDAIGLQHFVQTDAWTPVMARVHVSDASNLASTLGGERLYGPKKIVALRELLQNARDATVARRALEGRDQKWGNVEISLSLEDQTHVLRVKDEGIGMSGEVLTGSLIDFGGSYWRSDDVLSDHPSLMASEFEPNGKFGIGFFSCFMVADHVRVISRPLDSAKNETQVLEFRDGLGGRIHIRPANSDEQLIDSGTTVELRLRSNPRNQEGMLAPWHYRSLTLPRDESHKRSDYWTLNELCQWLAPAIDVNLNVAEYGLKSQAVIANDWVDIAPEHLLARALMYRDADDRREILESENAKDRMRQMTIVRDDEGKAIGRAAICKTLPFKSDLPIGQLSLFAPNVVTAGRFRSHETLYICGLFLGCPSIASRNAGNPLAQIDGALLANWASGQGDMIAELECHHTIQADLAGFVRVLGGNARHLACFRTKDGMKTFAELCSMRLPDQVDLLQDFWGTGERQAELKPNQISVVSGKMKSIHDWALDSDPFARADHKIWNRFWMSLWGAAIEAVSESWGCDLQDVLQNMISRKNESLPNGGIRMSYDTLIRP